MSTKHYTDEEIKLFLDPDFGNKNKDLESQILEHLKTCEACSGLARQVQKEMWSEIKRETKGF